MIDKPLKPVGEYSSIGFVTQSSEYVCVRKRLKPFPKPPSLQPSVKCGKYYEYFPLSHLPQHVDIQHEINCQLEALEPYRKTKVRRKKSFRLSHADVLRLKVINNFENKIKNSENAKRTRLTIEKVRSIITTYKKEKRVLCKKRGRCILYREEELTYIKEYFTLQGNVGKTLMHLQLDLGLKFDKAPSYYSLTTIHRVLKKFKFSYKKIKVLNVNSNSYENKERRKAVSFYLLECIAMYRKIIFIDETGICFNIHPKYGFSLRGTSPYFESAPESVNYSIVMSMDRYGIVSYMVFTESIKTEDFIAYLYLMVPKEYDDFKNKKLVFFMDNCSIHKSEMFKNSIEQDYVVLYNAPYTPYLNPIEQAFSFIKRRVRSASPKSFIELNNAIFEASCMVTSSISRSFVYSSLKYLRKCLNNEDLI